MLSVAKNLQRSLFSGPHRKEKTGCFLQQPALSEICLYDSLCIRVSKKSPGAPARSPHIATAPGAYRDLSASFLLSARSSFSSSDCLARIAFTLSYRSSIMISVFRLTL